MKRLVLDKVKMVVDADYLAELEREVEVLREKNANQREVLEFYRSSFHPVKGTFGLEWQPKESLLDDCGNMATEILTTP